MTPMFEWEENAEEFDGGEASTERWCRDRPVGGCWVVTNNGKRGRHELPWLLTSYDADGNDTMIRSFHAGQHARDYADITDGLPTDKDWIAGWNPQMDWVPEDYGGRGIVYFVEPDTTRWMIVERLDFPDDDHEVRIGPVGCFDLWRGVPVAGSEYLDEGIAITDTTSGEALAVREFKAHVRRTVAVKA